MAECLHDTALGMTGRWASAGTAAVTVVLLLAAAPTWARGCAAARTDAAAAAADHLRSWPEVFSFYRDYRDCDDGGVADAVTDAVVRLLPGHWGDLATLARIVRDNPNFKSIVLSHVDSTADTKDLERARNQSLQRCPPDLHPLCKDVAAAAEEAMQ